MDRRFLYQWGVFLATVSPVAECIFYVKDRNMLAVASACALGPTGLDLNSSGADSSDSFSRLFRYVNLTTVAILMTCLGVFFIVLFTGGLKKASKFTSAVCAPSLS